MLGATGAVSHWYLCLLASAYFTQVPTESPWADPSTQRLLGLAFNCPVHINASNIPVHMLSSLHVDLDLHSLLAPREPSISSELTPNVLAYPFMPPRRPHFPLSSPKRQARLYDVYDACDRVMQPQKITSLPLPSWPRPTLLSGLSSQCHISHVELHRKRAARVPCG